MAWLATENFDSYSAGTSISGGAGGSGWTGNWTLGSGTVKAETAPTGGQGCRALKGLNQAHNANRTFTSIDNSVAHFQFYSDDATAGNERDVAFEGGGTSRFQFRINVSSGGRYYGSNGTSYNTDLGAFSINTWYTVDVKFGHVAGKFAISFNGGAYSADLNTTGGVTAVDKFYFLSAQTPVGNFWIDDVGATAGAVCATGPANLKSLDTNLKANIKSYNTNLIANVKSINTNV